MITVDDAVEQLVAAEAEIEYLRAALLKLSDPVGHATPRERDAWIRRTALRALNHES